MKIKEQIEKCWFRTFSGRVIDPENLKPEDIDPVDIARSLSLQCRFGGQIVRFYSVAEHSLNVMHSAEADIKRLHRANTTNVLLGALLHDASEAYMCDIPTPFKKLVPQYKDLEAKVMDIIHKRFNVVLDEYEQKIINNHDKVALEYEMPILFNDPEKKTLRDLEYYTPDQAFSLYLNTLLRLEKENS